MLFKTQLQSLVATFYCPMGVEQRCERLPGHRKDTRPPSHHVVVVVPVDDVGWRKQLLLDGRRWECGGLHPGLEQVRHVENLADTRGEEQVNEAERDQTAG